MSPACNGTLFRVSPTSSKSFRLTVIVFERGGGSVTEEAEVDGCCCEAEEAATPGAGDGKTEGNDVELDGALEVLATSLGLMPGGSSEESRSACSGLVIMTTSPASFEIP